MQALIKREINSFFASPIGYLVIALFLVFNGLFLWVFSGTFNILDAGFADLSAFFQLAPKHLALAHKLDQYQPDFDKAYMDVEQQITKSYDGYVKVEFFKSSEESKWQDKAEEAALEEIIKAKSGDFETKAQRPGFSALDCTHFQNTFGIFYSDWKDSLKAALSS